LILSNRRDAAPPQPSGSIIKNAELLVALSEVAGQAQGEIAQENQLEGVVKVKGRFWSVRSIDTNFKRE